ncbi:Lrp/AsnC ligand binding domain-containing protein [Candidatus Woesearchaeota archaeon]|jgi:DNA-binding Lrp family transcriptional regulator|nr:Lrp/AsnC ligand binding domain-containing protein [Candidatus Woesearchaeota archaeon]
MTVEAFVLLNIKTGSIKEVIKSLKEFKELSVVASTAGSYDLVVNVKVEDLAKLHDFVTTTLQRIEGIVQTESLIVAKKIER